MMWRALWYSEWRGLRREWTQLVELVAFVGCVMLILQFLRSSVQIAGPVLAWILIILSGMMYWGRSFEREWSSDGSRALEGYRQIPGLLRPLFWIKWSTNTLICIVVCVLAALVYDDGSQWWRWALAPMLLGTSGLAGLGTLFALGLAQQQQKGFALAIICYPLSIPLILSVAQCLHQGLAYAAIDAVWIKICAGTALLYVTVSSLLFPLLAEE